MNPNPLLKKLGYSNTDRLVIFHTDDIGMCQASVQAFKDMWQFGVISSGAVMVPCPWFPAAAEMCRQNPQMDMGVHITLNCEYEFYRWGALSTCDPHSGLLDADGYLFKDRDPVYQNARPEAVTTEVNLQVERALAAGIDITHIDTHMGTVVHPNFVQSYLLAGMSRQLPVMLPRLSAKGFDMMGMDSTALAVYAPILEQLEAQGVPMLDGLFSMPLGHSDNHVDIAKKLIADLPVGITHFILHPAVDTPELRAIAPDWRARVANYHAFMSDELKAFLQDSGVHAIGYRMIREAMRGAG